MRSANAASASEEMVDGRRELVYRFRWSLTQIVVLVIGMLMMIVGGIGLARAGSAGITSAIEPEVAVGLWQRTPLMAFIELAAGLILVVEGAQPKGNRAWLRLAGALALVFGIVLVAQPATFDSALGASRATGWTYGLFGAVLLGLGFGAPIVFERESVEPLDEGYLTADDDTPPAVSA